MKAANTAASVGGADDEAASMSVAGIEPEGSRFMSGNILFRRGPVCTPRATLESDPHRISAREKVSVEASRIRGVIWPVQRRQGTPNKAPEPTPGLVMPRAEPRVMPSPGVAHL